MLGKEQLIATLREIVAVAGEAGVDCEVRYMNSRETTMRPVRGQASDLPDLNHHDFVIRLREKGRYLDFSPPFCPLENVRDELGPMTREHIEGLRTTTTTEDLWAMVSPPSSFPEEEHGLQSKPPAHLHDPDFKVEVLERMRRRATSWELSGHLYVIDSEIGVVNSLGLQRYQTHWHTGFSVTAHTRRQGNQFTAHAYNVARLPEQLNVEGTIEEALQRAALIDSLPVEENFFGSRSKRRCDVILSPNAARVWLEEFLPDDFSGDNLNYGLSLLNKKRRGERVASRLLSVADEPDHPGVIPIVFDFGGRTTQRVQLVERGRYRGVAWDDAAALIAKKQPTGHSLQKPGDGRVHSIIVEDGSSTHEDFIAQSMRPTVEISHLHYLSLVSQKKSIVGASTQHGTFLIEGGRYKAVISTPLRVRIPSIKALHRIDGLTKSRVMYDDEKYCVDFPNSYIIPEMRLRSVVWFLNSTT